MDPDGAYIQLIQMQEKDSRVWALVFTGLGLVVLVGIPIKTHFIGIAGGKRILRMRSMSVRPVLHQEISFFNEPSNLRASDSHDRELEAGSYSTSFATLDWFARICLNEFFERIQCRCKEKRVDMSDQPKSSPRDVTPPIQPCQSCGRV
ncbi:hypothetical protein QJS04_geneDACA000793 [Acorus gramineus]|uniref:ABC transmembrane type-1 domain-containing protein n=1 Tax=Acorus gramineus TaxID=55184 RepID=A0AAV9BKN8_ACOGR|nr:hypothetical protein QJS04_geneDACA000793 [Acorus gramineus]